MVQTVMAPCRARRGRRRRSTSRSSCAGAAPGPDAAPRAAAIWRCCASGRRGPAPGRGWAGRRGSSASAAPQVHRVPVDGQDGARQVLPGEAREVGRGEAGASTSMICSCWKNSSKPPRKWPRDFTTTARAAADVEAEVFEEDRVGALRAALITTTAMPPICSAGGAAQAASAPPAIDAAAAGDVAVGQGADCRPPRRRAWRRDRRPRRRG